MAVLVQSSRTPAVAFVPYRQPELVAQPDLSPAARLLVLAACHLWEPDVPDGSLPACLVPGSGHREQQGGWWHGALHMASAHGQQGLPQNMGILASPTMFQGEERGNCSP